MTTLVIRAPGSPLRSAQQGGSARANDARLAAPIYGAAGLFLSRRPRHHQAMPPTRSAKASTANATQPQSVLSGSSVVVATAAPAAAAAPGLPVVVVTVFVTVAAAAAGAVVVTVDVIGAGAVPG